MVGDSQILIGAHRLKTLTLVPIARAIRALIGPYSFVQWTRVRQRFNTAANFLMSIAWTRVRLLHWHHTS
jgi:hypothetical protein